MQKPAAAASTLVASARTAGVDVKSTRFRRILLGVVVLACSPNEKNQTTLQNQEPASIENRVAAIQADVERIDAAVEAAGVGDLLAKEVPHWEFSGLLEGSKPRFLSARLTQGRLVREESYYHVDGALRLVKVSTWWDVDDPSQAPEPPTRRYFYVANDGTFRRTREVTSKPTAIETTDVDESAAPFTVRSRAIAVILLSNDVDTAAIRFLELFPEAERVKP